MQTKLQSGTKVKVVGDPRYPNVKNVGEIATVLTPLFNTSGVYGVEFDHEVVEGHTCDGIGTYGRCLWLTQEVLEVVNG